MPSRQVLTLKYRPQTFDELLIQDHVTSTLKRAIELNRLANAYLFAGPRGVGKTTTARILAKSLNCTSFDKPTTTPCNKCSACVEITESRSLDVLEIDGASERRIDDIRELRENIRYTPLGLRYKMYIIDEVHMLTPQAFNALLKTLEEPPAHAKFIFATTEPHRVPMTIISRCQRFDFRRATPAEIIDRLAWLAQKEAIKITPEALAAIARRADGAIRDAESILDQLWSYSPEGIELSHVEELLGLVPANLFRTYADRLIAGDAPGLVALVDRLFEAGYDFIEFYSGLVEHFRDLLLLQVSGAAPGAGLLAEEEKELRRQAQAFGCERLLAILDTLSRNEEVAKYTRTPRVLLELLSLELVASAPRTIEPSNPRTIPADSLAAIWNELTNRLSREKPSIASTLGLGRPLSWEGQLLTIALPVKHRATAELLETNRPLIEATLTQITGQPAKFQLVFEPAGTQPDSALENITRILGAVEESKPFPRPNRTP